MNYRQLGVSGLKVSPICLGAMMFGDRTTEASSLKIISSAKDAGINFIDTADAYAGGESERIVGKAIRRDRDNWVLATKIGNPTGSGVNQRGLNRKHMIAAVEASLMRMKTDYTDILYFHMDDTDTPLEESIETVAELIASGKVRYWGMSNFRGWRIALAASICEASGFPMPIVCQPYYNAMNRMPEVDILPACDYFGLGVVPYSPLARGVLTGKYNPDMSQPKGTRAGINDTRMMQTEFRKESIVMAQQIKEHAEQQGMTAGQFAVNWVLNNAIITSVLAGPRTMGQWKEYLGALKHGFSSSDEALIESLVASGHPSTPGYTDPRYPTTGREAMTG